MSVWIGRGGDPSAVATSLGDDPRGSEALEQSIDIHWGECCKFKPEKLIQYQTRTNLMADRKISEVDRRYCQGEGDKDNRKGL